ncbi:MAG: TRAP transporter substrate-binding protein, partial [Xanthomonadales bacterium]|nr:TRAP transporter substrate-binding protein [Xanthomonadales bacterium]
DGRRFRWRMVMTWPDQFPIFGTSAVRLAESIQAASAGRLQIDLFGAGDLVPAFETFDAVSSGLAEMGHSSPVYWRGKIPAAQLFSGIPFGMTAQELNAWLDFGDGAALWESVYAPFDVLPLAAGNTGVQMGGWYRRPIRSNEDLQGMKIRIAGLGAEVLRAAGATTVVIPGGELFTALQTGVIDGAEFTGPFNDRAWGLNQLADHYYYPGWHEPAGMLECLVNRDAFNELPDDLQAIVRLACRAQNDAATAEFAARNQGALADLRKDGIEPSPFPTDVLARLRELTPTVLDQVASTDSVFADVLAEFRSFQAQISHWTRIADQSYYSVRSAPD